MSTARCAFCKEDVKRHADDCLWSAVTHPESLDNSAGADRTTDQPSAAEVSREDPERTVYLDPYPPAWDDEPPEKLPKFEHRVTHRREGGNRNRSKIYQRRHYALRRFRRLMRSSGRGGLAPIEYLVLERRQVGEWETVRDLPWNR